MAIDESNLAELEFSEEDCVAYFYAMKWPDGFRCPKCGHSQAYTIQTRRLPLFECRVCRHQTTITADTIMEKSRTPLRKWRIALQLVSEPASVNAVRLAEILSVTYKTAFSMLKKIRQSISKHDQSQLLTGLVRGGLDFYGQRTLQPFWRHPKEHPVVAAASFRSGSPTYVKLKSVPVEYIVDKQTLHPSAGGKFYRDYVQPGTLDYRMLKKSWYLSTPLRGIFKQAKKWLDQTFHGIGLTYLQTYWDEYAFRLSQKYRKEPALESLCKICMSS